ncbi:hypothetical protein NPA31_011795 [Aurantimonas sp. MSK8Z-1]|uniref:hypothetical protein n=1 Tax=Mangrovibrevibacter kandeliae TaxID=2968473 RepID=UPI0021186D1F|nr:hypothetical protein [Aurantimonas sp. MSK8Z-1]MCW4115646.1 hypothetical protein [Aurantimonas sp. MSK8Z-1]
MTFDELRAAHPELGAALYAYEPGVGVTLELLTPDGAQFLFTGPTAQAAIDAAFPPDPIDLPAPAPPSAFD